MSKPTRFRTKRCDHFFAAGLCEVATCVHAAKYAGQANATIAIVKPPRCSVCKRETADATRREGIAPLYCDFCFTQRVERNAEVERRARYFDRRSPMFSALKIAAREKASG